MGLPDIEVVDATAIFKEIRLVKTPPEIELLRRAATINEAATEAAIGALHEGALWDEIVAVFNRAMTAAGGRPRYLLTSLGGLAHGHVVRGEPMLFDALGEYGHYLGDFGRIAVVGEASSELRRRVRAMQDGLQAGLALLRPGLKRSVLIDTVIEATRKAGFPEFFYVSPHSLGLEHTDNPMPLGFEVFDSTRDLELLEDMVFNIDMPYFEHGWGTLHIEDTVRITRRGYEPLTSLKTDLRLVA
jgi:Xaa-Pro aminopeptidase